MTFSPLFSSKTHLPLISPVFHCTPCTNSNYPKNSLILVSTCLLSSNSAPEREVFSSKKISAVFPFALPWYPPQSRVDEAPIWSSRWKSSKQCFYCTTCRIFLGLVVKIQVFTHLLVGCWAKKPWHLQFSRHHIESHFYFLLRTKVRLGILLLEISGESIYFGFHQF